MLIGGRCAACGVLWLTVGLACAVAAPPAEHSAIGRTIESFTLVDVHGQSRSLADFSDKQLVVVAFIDTECPLASALCRFKVGSVSAELG